MPDGWEYIRLSVVCWLDDIKSSTGEKLPYLDAKTLRGKGDKTLLTSGKIVDIGTKIILVDGENSGEVFNVPFRGYMGSTFKILGISDYVNAQYLNNVLDFYRDLFRGSKIGAAIPHLNKTLFRSLIIGLPPLAEQERIVAEIEKYEPLIAEYDKLKQEKSKLDGEIYDKLKKSILQYAIQGKLVPQELTDEPASVLLEKIRADKKAKLGKKYVDSFIYKGDDNCYYEHIDGVAEDKPVEVPFDLPDNWIWERIPNVTFFQEGPGIMAQDFRNTGIPLIRIAGMQSDKVCLIGCNYLDAEMVEKKWKHFRLDKGDVVISTSASMDKIAEVFDDTVGAIPYTGLIRFKMSGALLKCYFKYFFRSDCYIKQIDAQKSGTTIQHYGPSHLQRMLIPLPPLAEQQRIVDKINEIFANL